MNNNLHIVSVILFIYFLCCRTARCSTRFTPDTVVTTSSRSFTDPSWSNQLYHHLPPYSTSIDWAKLPHRCVCFGWNTFQQHVSLFSFWLIHSGSLSFMTHYAIWLPADWSVSGIYPLLQLGQKRPKELMHHIRTALQFETLSPMSSVSTTLYAGFFIYMTLNAADKWWERKVTLASLLPGVIRKPDHCSLCLKVCTFFPY